MPRFLAVLALLAWSTVSLAQQPPSAVTRDRQMPDGKPVYDERTDSTTRSIAAYAIVDTSLTPPDTFVVELSQQWKGQGTVAPIAPVELGLGRTRATGLPGSRRLLGSTPRDAAVVFLLDGARRIRLERAEYVSNAGATMTFETARYRLSAADLRRIAECRELRIRVGDHELWIDPAWRRVAADMVAGQTSAAAEVRR